MRLMWKLSAILPHAPGLIINGSIGQAKSPAARGRAVHTLTTWIEEGRVNSKNGLFGKDVCVPVSHGEELQNLVQRPIASEVFGMLSKNDRYQSLTPDLLPQKLFKCSLGIHF